MDAPFSEQDEGGLVSEDGSYLYFIGIIDILTYYSGKKKLEHFFKGNFQGDGISCVPPAEYAERFVGFMRGALR